MGREKILFEEIPGIDELTDEDRAIEARRLDFYCKEALRIGKLVDSIYLLHDQFRVAVRACDRIFQISKELGTGHGLRLYGPSGTGVSSVYKYFSKSLPSSTLFSPGWGCIGVRAYPKTSAGHLVGGLLRAYKYPFTRLTEQVVYEKRSLVFELVRQKGTRLIFVDKAQHLLRGERKGCVSPTGNDFLCELIDETNVGIVLAGDEELAIDERLAEAIKSKITGRLELQPFKASAQWEGVVKSFVKNCVWIDLTLLLLPGQLKTLHGATDGNMRALKRLITEAVMVCVQQKQRAVSREHMKEAFDLVFGTTSNRINPYVGSASVAAAPSSVS